MSAAGDALHRAAKAGDVGVLNALLAAGADVERHDARGWTALMHAVNEGQGPLTELLLAVPADPDARAAARGTTRRAGCVPRSGTGSSLTREET